MKYFRSAGGLLAAALAVFNWTPLVSSLADTDTITSCGDNSRACYETNHNMDPAVVGSSAFGQLWRLSLTGNYRNIKEQLFAQPLVFTPNAGTTQYVYLSTTQNKVYKIDAKTGDIVAERTLAIPFLTADLDGCLDINPLVGNTATGVIDPDTETWYLTIKTYRDQSDVEKGRLNGRYLIYAIDTTTLADRPNFPVPLEDIAARNNPKRLFKGGNQHQRPALLQHGQFIYAGFASHCVQYNFSGWLVGWDKTSGDIVESYAMQGGPESTEVKGGGIWMSGGGISSDNRGSMWFATGNGYASQLHGTPVPGRQPPSSLEEAAVHATIQEDGTIRVVDFFMPYEKEALDGADQDLGTSPLNIAPFGCPNAPRIGVVTGKNSKTYFLDLDNLGGYCMSDTKQDAILGVYKNENSVYAGAGYYPLSATSGYIYINIIQYPTRVFEFSCDANGNPRFVPVAYSTEKNAYILGVGHGTITSFPGKPNSGLSWVSDVQGFGLRIYKATPENGIIPTLRTFTVPGVTKFQKPVFGNGIAYIGTNQGYLYAFGSPVNSPLECSDPYDFGNANIGSTTAAKTVSCRAKIALQVTGVGLSSITNFQLDTVPTVPATIAAGSNFTFTAVFSPQTVGTLTADVYLNTTNDVAGYSTQISASLTGTGRSSNALLVVRPETVTFAGYITGSSTTGVDQTFIVANDGDSPLTITSYQFSTQSATGPWVDPTISGNTHKVGPFTFYDLPTSVAANNGADVNVNFYTNVSSSYTVYVKINSSVGSKTVNILATAADPPKAVIEFEKPDKSGWVTFDPDVPFSFGDVVQQNTLNLKLRVTNNGGPNAASLSITVSKPPVGSDSIIGASNGVDLAEGVLIATGQSETANLYCSVPRTQVNTDPYKGYAVWTMNINDPTFGKQTFQFECNAIAEQFGPMTNSTTGLYRYIGCAKENNPGRQLKTQLWSRPTNDNEACIEACYAAGWTFAGTQYHSECWCGNDVPTEISLERDCNFGCSLTEFQMCGGNGYFGGGAFISLFARSDKYVPGQQPTGTTTSTSTTPTPTHTGNPSIYNGYVHQGCWSQPGGPRALANLIAANSSMYIEMCIDAAIQKGYTYCGVEYGQECWGGTTIRAESEELSIDQCSFDCPGSPSEKCGAGSKFNLYIFDPAAVSSTTTTTTPTAATTSSSTTTTTTSSPTTTSSSTTPTPTQTGNPSIYNGYVHQGCWSQPGGPRALANLIAANSSMYIEMCIDAAIQKGYTYCGVEYGEECWGGTTIRAESEELSIDQCSFDCPGNPSEKCGAGSKFNLYIFDPAAVSSATTSSSTTTTTTSSLTTTSSTATSSTTTTTTTTTTSTTPTPTQTGNPSVYNGYVHQGCWSQPDGPRALANLIAANSSMYIEMCIDAAIQKGYTYCGVEYGEECWGGTTIRAESEELSIDQCDFDCPGNPSEKCGAGSKFNLYIFDPAAVSSATTSSLTTTTSSSTTTTTTTTTTTSSPTTTSSTTISSTIASSTTAATTTTTTTPPTTTATTVVATGNPSTVGAFTTMGCYKEPSGGRAIPNALHADDTMTVEKCAIACADYKYFGLEYGRECWCGDVLNVTPSGGPAPQGDCSLTCKGNAAQKCGAGNRLDTYSKP
ncbi:uncharacterized protein DFL_003880 [Arthrobotrys flagrans]|uniref:WSC domain-containing protein n=1 Tax=Arthrobotrys flagrans TaxID=97331 RepID=A0A437A3B5_ARTFL|nr:hypothetical protein DFL_003880 [Arthrobotrys flagrans]